jgi:hypothetical protein
MNDRYPGTNGKTHGDKNEITPAKTATGIANSNDPDVTVVATSACIMMSHPVVQL